MNQTVTVNISGVVFHIEVDAYKKLNDYLEKIRSYFKNADECEEIMTDIESRIAELLNPKISTGNQVIRMKDVDEVVEIMGRPEQYIQDEAEESADSAGQERTYSSRKRTKKRIFRDPDDRLLGGVASGLAKYFGTDPVFIRLFFVIALFMGFGFLTYIILWIVIPEAKTASEKLQMKGEPINIENIGKTFEKGANKFNEKVKDFDENAWSRRVENFFQSLGDFIVAFFTGLFKAIGKLLGVVLILAGLFFTIAFVSGWLTSETMIYAITPEGFFSIESDDFFNAIFVSEQQFHYAKMALMAVLGIPILGLILGGLKLLLGIRGNLGVGIGLGIVWVFAGMVCAFIGFQVAADFKTESKLYDSWNLQTQEEQIVLKMDEKDIPGQEFMILSNDDFFLNMDSLNIYLGFPTLDIKRSKNDSLVMEIERTGHGMSRKTAADRARNIQYTFKQESNLIWFDPFYEFKKLDKIRAQEIEMILRLPIGQRIYIDPSMEFIIYDIENTTDTYDDDMLGHSWEMTEEGLHCLDCEED